MNEIQCSNCGKVIGPGESFRTSTDPTILCKDCQPKPVTPVPVAALPVESTEKPA